MKHRRLSLVLVAALVLVTGACGRSEPPPFPSPSPVATNSPNPSVDASAEALHAEAERVYLAFQVAQEKYSVAGDYSEFPPEMTDYLGTGYLAAVEAHFEEQKSAGNRLVGGAPKHHIAPAPGTSTDQSVVAIATCYDARGLVVMNGEGAEISQGILSQGIYYFNYFDDQLKIINADVWEAESCSLE